MTSKSVNNHGPGAQNVATGGASQFSQNGNAPQYNNCTVNADPQVDATEKLRVEKEACLRSLRFGELHARYHDIAEAHPGTCDWLFTTSEFQHWTDAAYRQAHNGVLWIKGKPGAGKSTLMKHAYHRYRKDLFRDRLIVAYFFNARGENLEKAPLGLLRSIVYQLLRNDDDIYKSFTLFFPEKPWIDREANWQWRLSELQSFVRSIVRQSHSRPLLIVVDALDECNDSDVRDVVKFLETLSIQAFRSGVSLQICLSSRHYPSIRMNKVVELRVEDSRDHQADIANYIEVELTKHEHSAEMEAELVKRANNVFLWVVIVVSMLNKAYDEGRLEAMQKALDEIPADLEKVFSALVAKSADMAETVLMLQWVLLSKKSLQPEELCAAVGVHLPTIEMIQRRITTSSKGLIEIRKGMEDSVQFIHLSVRDFLFRQKRLQTLDPTLGPEPIVASHGRLWACCWSHIKQADITRTSEQHMIRMREKDPFLEYAADHILDHADRAIFSGGVMSDGGGKRESRPGAPDTSQQETIKQWLQNPEQWYPWWKWFFKPKRSHFELRRDNLTEEARAGLLYVSASVGLCNLVRVYAVGIIIHARGGEYGNALQAASAYGKQEIVRLLLYKGADVDAQGGYYGNALQAASFDGVIEIVQLLLDRGADVNAQGGEYGNALQAASAIGKQEIVQLLLDKGADVNAQGGEYGNALQAASAYGYKEIVQLLLDKGADVNAQGGEYGNALQAASFDGDIEIVQLLLDRGADVNAQGGLFNNALQAASTKRHPEIVQMLLKRWG